MCYGMSCFLSIWMGDISAKAKEKIQKVFYNREKCGIL